MDAPPVVEKQLNPFERYLTIWVALCMVAGVLLGQVAPGLIQILRTMEFGQGSHINLPIAMLIWLMIVPMMMKVDFASIRHVGTRPTGLSHYAVRQLGDQTVFDGVLCVALLPRRLCRLDYAGRSRSVHRRDDHPGRSPCTAMVFVWSYLTDGDPAYTLVQVSVNDLIMLVLFAPIVGLLVSGASSLSVPFDVLLYSVLAFIVIPLAIGWGLRAWLVRQQGQRWVEDVLLPRFAPVTIAALLLTLVFIFAFQAQNIMGKTVHVLLIAVPILLQVYVNASLAYGLMHRFRVPYAIAAPGALIGASNFFELAVATAIALFGAESGAALATVVGVLVEVPVMLSVCGICNRTRHWFTREAVA